jgi:uncharacterized coiled-coil protein SlyX
VLGSAGFWGYKQSRKEAPIKKEQADIAAASTTVQMALSVATAAKAHSEGLGKEMGELKGRVDGLERQVREQEHTISSLREVVRAFSSAWDDLTARWETLRQQDQPPPKPRTYNP